MAAPALQAVEAVTVSAVTAPSPAILPYVRMTP
jgi:hypothetical protein